MRPDDDPSDPDSFSRREPDWLDIVLLIFLVIGRLVALPFRGRRKNHHDK